MWSTSTCPGLRPPRAGQLSPARGLSAAGVAAVAPAGRAVSECSRTVSVSRRATLPALSGRRGTRMPTLPGQGMNISG